MQIYFTWIINTYIVYYDIGYYYIGFVRIMTMWV